MANTSRLLNKIIGSSAYSQKGSQSPGLAIYRIENEWTSV